MASNLIKFCIIHHHILRWKTTIEIGKEENHLGLLSRGGGTSSKVENCSCRATGAVTSNGALTISVVVVSVSGVDLVAASIFLELSVSRGSASRVCSNISRSLPGSPWSIMKLMNTRRPIKGKHNRNDDDNETKKRVRNGYCFAKVFFFCEWKYNNITDPLTFPSFGEKNSGRCECCLLTVPGTRGYSPRHLAIH